MYSRLAKRGIHHGSAQERIEKEEQGPQGGGQAAFCIRQEIQIPNLEEEARRPRAGANSKLKDGIGT